MNPRCAPARICVRHVANQCANVSGHGRPPDSAPTPPGPPQPEASSMPGDDGFRLDEDERRPPSYPDAREPDPEPTVRFRERTRRGRVRSSTCSWCRNASTSSWSTAREHAHVRRVRRNETSTEIIAKSVPIVGRNINWRNKNGLFSNHSLDAASQPHSLQRGGCRYSGSTSGCRFIDKVLLTEDFRVNPPNAGSEG